MKDLHAMARLALALDKAGMHRTAGLIDTMIDVLHKEAYNEHVLVAHIKNTKEEVDRLTEEMNEAKTILEEMDERVDLGDDPTSDLDMEHYEVLKKKIDLWPKIIDLVKERVKSLQKELDKRRHQGMPANYDPHGRSDPFGW